MSETTDRMNVLMTGFDARVQAAPTDSWSNPSPCSDWAARDIVVHVGNNLLNLAGAIGGDAQDPIADDEDAVAAWNRARSAFSAAMATGDLSVTVPGPMGPMPAEQLIGRLIATDVLVHTWDLARAVGGDEQLPADIVAGAFSGLKPMDAMLRGPGVFGPKIEAPEGADEQTQFLCFLGRAV